MSRTTTEPCRWIGSAQPPVRRRPLCDVFAGLPAPQVARDLSRLAAEHDPELRAKLTGVSDPLEVLRLIHDLDQSLSRRVEEALIAAEIEAVQVAGDPIEGGVEAMDAVRRSGRPITVVTNNSTDCVHSFFDLHGLSYLVDAVVGRVPHRPDLMKPNPCALLRAAEAVDVAPTACVLIGDSVTDIPAAHAAGGTAIGYANKPHKREALTEAGAEAVTEDMRAIAHVLRHAVED